MARRPSASSILADASKLGAAPFEAWAPLDAPWTLVTDSGADPGMVERFATAGAEDTVAEVPDAVEASA